MREWLVLLAVGVGTYLMRVAFLVSHRTTPPATVQRALPVCRAGGVGAMVVPALILPGGSAIAAGDGSRARRGGRLRPDLVALREHAAGPAGRAVGGGAAGAALEYRPQVRRLATVPGSGRGPSRRVASSYSRSDGDYTVLIEAAIPRVEEWRPMSPPQATVGDSATEVARWTAVNQDVAEDTGACGLRDGPARRHQRGPGGRGLQRRAVSLAGCALPEPSPEPVSRLSWAAGSACDDGAYAEESWPSEGTRSSGWPDEADRSRVARGDGAA